MKKTGDFRQKFGSVSPFFAPPPKKRLELAALGQKKKPVKVITSEH
jgi:hypothetical protein